LGFHRSRYPAKGQPITSCYVRRDILHPIRERLGIARGGFHAFRHGLGTALMQGGANARVVQQQLGHADLRMLARYAHVVSQDQRAAVERTVDVFLRRSAANLDAKSLRFIRDHRQKHGSRPTIKVSLGEPGRAFLVLGARMKTTVILLAAVTALLVIVGTEQVFAQKRTPVKVKGSEVVTGVVIVDILKDGKPLELQCNQGASTCKTLKSGGYVMVEFPKNFGMYDCRNIEIYDLRRGQGQARGSRTPG